MMSSFESTRRIFLMRSLQVLGAGALVATVGCSPAQSPQPVLKTFAPGDYKAFAAIADTFIPRGGAFPTGAADVNVAARADRIFATWDADVFTGLRGAIQFVEHQAPGLVGAKGAFSDLDSATRTKIVAAMIATQDVPAQIYSAMKFVVCTFFVTADAVWPHIGYPGPMIEGN